MTKQELQGWAKIAAWILGIVFVVFVIIPNWREFDARFTDACGILFGFFFTRVSAFRIRNPTARMLSAPMSKRPGTPFTVIFSTVPEPTPCQWELNGGTIY